MADTQQTSRATSPGGFWGVRTPFAPSACPGVYGWVIVCAATLGSIFSIPGQTMGFTVFTDVLMEKLGLSRVELSLAYCLGTVASGLTLPWLGRVLDRWGERKMAVVSTGATGFILFYLAASAPMSHGLGRVLPASLAAFLVIGFGFYLVRAAAQGVLSMTCRNAIGKWFDHRRGLAMAVSSILVSFTFSLSPKATVLERAVPFDPETYPVPAESFRGFRGVVVGTITDKSEQGYELTLKINSIESSQKSSRATDPKASVGRLMSMRGFFDQKFRARFGDLKIGDRILVGAVPTDPTVDSFTVVEELKKQAATTAGDKGKSGK